MPKTMEIMTEICYNIFVTVGLHDHSESTLWHSLTQMSKNILEVENQWQRSIVIFSLKVMLA